MDRIVALWSIAVAGAASGTVAEWFSAVRQIDVNNQFARAGSQAEIDALQGLWPPVQALSNLSLPLMIAGLVAALAALALHAWRWDLRRREPAPSVTADPLEP